MVISKVPVLIISFGVQAFNLTSFFADGIEKCIFGFVRILPTLVAYLCILSGQSKNLLQYLKKALQNNFWQNAEMIVWLISSFQHMKNPLSKKEFKTYVTIWHGRIIEEVLF